MPLAILTAPDEGRVQGQGDHGGRRYRLSRSGVPQVRADLERVSAQGLGVVPASIGRRCSSTPAATR